MKANPIASMAARSPLLLGFLVQLVHHGITFAGHRAALYEQVLTLWYQMSSKDRNSTVVKPSITFAHEILNYVGWFLQQASLEEGHSKREMIDALASKLHQNGQSLLMTKEKVEHCLEFWQERGVLELLQIGPEDAYTFIHATLGEYVAGRYLASLDDTKIRTHLEKVRHEAHWRETLLLAAGAGKANIIAEHLLFLDRNNDPVATESLLAAAALAESVQSFPVLAVKIARHITDRLCSSIPLVAYESAQNCVGLATQLPEQIGSLLHPLFYHPQSWTRLTALRLMLAAGEAVVNINALEMFFDDLLTPEQVSAPSGSSPLQTLQAQDARRYFLERREPWSTSNEVIALGAKMLVNKRPSEATAIRLERLARLKRDINDSALNALLQGLELLGCTDVADQIRKEYTEQLNTLSWNNAVKKCRQGEKAFLEAVLRATGISPAIEGNQRRPIALSILLYALELPQWPIREWSVFDERYDLAAIDVVLTGTIIALGLSYTEVAIDTAWVLARVTNISQATNAGIPLLSVLSEITVEPEWRRVIEKANLPTADLVRALLHPSQVIAFGAAQLLEAGAGGQETSILLEDILDQGNDFALEMIALIADSIWGKEAFTKLLRRLDSPLSDGCRWLLQALPRLSEGQADEQVREILIRSLTTDNPQIVIAVAETLQSLPDTFLKPSTEIQKAFTLWSTRGDYCEEHQHYVRSECSGRVPLCPRVEILKLLSRVSALPLHEWLDACRDPHQHVRKAALQGVTRTLTSQPEYILEVIGDVNKGQHPSSVLEAILSLPTAHLVSEQKTLLALFSSESAILRRIMIRNAATATWLTKEQAINVAQVALEDSDPTIRNLAVTTMRRLKSSS